MAKEKKRSYQNWKREEDDKLTNVVIDAVKQGKSQKDGFATYAEMSGRTESSVAFRWNNTLRKNNEEALAQAKLEGKEAKKQTDENMKSLSDNDTNQKSESDKRGEKSITQEDIVAFIEGMEDYKQKYEWLVQDYEELERKYQDLKKRFDNVSSIIADVS